MVNDYHRDIVKKELSFRCPDCHMVIVPPFDSMTVRAYLNGMCTQEQAIETLRRNHERHVHTEYDEQRRRLYVRMRHEGIHPDDARSRAKNVARQKLEEKT
jgi:hypothetical protein